jgi:hypothetical protein
MFAVKLAQEFVQHSAAPRLYVRPAFVDRPQRRLILIVGPDTHHLAENSHRHDDVRRVSGTDFQESAVRVDGLPQLFR